MTIARKAELRVFEKTLPSLLSDHEGKWALVDRKKVLSIHDSFKDALAAGYSTFGLNPFLVKRIVAVEQPHFVGVAVV